MKIVTAPEEIVSIFAPLEKETTLFDKAGKVVGTFLPAALFDDALKAQIEAVEERDASLQRESSDEHGRTDS